MKVVNTAQGHAAGKGRHYRLRAGGLSTAHFLALAGYRVTVFDSASRPGGLLRSGIPEYRLPEAILNRELERLKAWRIRFQVKTQFGRDLKLGDLKALLA